MNRPTAALTTALTTALTALTAVLAAGCVSTPTQGQKDAQRAYQGPPQPTVTVVQPTTVTRTCEGPCPTTPTTTTNRTSTTPSTASAPARTAGTPATGSAPAPTAPATPRPYSRDEFGTGWADPDRNGCDARQDAVREATTRIITRTSACQIRVADIRDVYSGRTHPNANTSSFDVDHVVSLHDAWTSGAWKWTRTKRVAYANDPTNLVLTTASTNRSKSDQGPDTWAPTSHTGACWYVRTYRNIKRVYALHTTGAQRAAIRRTLTTCNGTEGRQ